MSTHPCAIPGCATGAAEGMLMCRPHWRRVPPSDAAAVWRTWKVWQGRGKIGRAEYLDAVRAAVVAVVAYDEAAGGEEMLALSVRQPYASAVMHMPGTPGDWKNVENRGWPRSVPTGGMWLAWHAAKVVDIEGCQLVEPRWPGAPRRTQLVTSAVLGVVHVAAWVDTATLTADHPYAWVLDSRWRDPRYRYAIVIDQRIALPEPIDCPGQMQLWPLPAAALSACRALVAGVSDGE